MKLFIGFMFVVVISSVWGLVLDWGDIGMVLFYLCLFNDFKVVMFIFGLIGGVGGSVMLLSYVYWIFEKGWSQVGFMKYVCIDLGIVYMLSSLFGVVLVIIVVGVSLEQVNGYGMILSLAE